MQTADLRKTAVPFAMQFATLPAATSIMEVEAGTLTTVYSTDCGPNNSPDDGADTSTDDD